MRVWITRSEPGASRQAAALRAAGHQVLVCPLVRIEPTGRPVPGGRFQHVVFLSEQAVLHGGRLGYCRGARVHAIGGATAAALAERGLRAEVPAAASTEGLLAHLQCQVPEGGRVLIVAGEDGRKTLRDSLRRLGARVEEHLCYRRLPVAETAVDAAAIDAVLVGSQDGFRALARVWFHSGGGPDVLLVAASPRVAALAPELGFRNVRVADGAAVEDWIGALGNEGGSG